MDLGEVRTETAQILDLDMKKDMVQELEVDMDMGEVRMEMVQVL